MRRRIRLVAVLVATSALSACQQLDLPEQGFVTRQIGTYGNFLRDTIEPSGDFGGHALGSVASSIPANPIGRIDECERSARERAQDVEVQGFDGELQKQEYELTLADCRKWSARR